MKEHIKRQRSCISAQESYWNMLESPHRLLPSLITIAEGKSWIILPKSESYLSHTNPAGFPSEALP